MQIQQMFDETCTHDPRVVAASSQQTQSRSSYPGTLSCISGKLLQMLVAAKLKWNIMSANIL